MSTMAAIGSRLSASLVDHQRFPRNSTREIWMGGGREKQQAEGERRASCVGWRAEHTKMFKDDGSEHTSAAPAWRCSRRSCCDFFPRNIFLFVHEVGPNIVLVT